MSDDRTLLVWDCPNCGCRRMKRVKVGSDNSRKRIEGGQTFRRRMFCSSNIWRSTCAFTLFSVIGPL